MYMPRFNADVQRPTPMEEAPMVENSQRVDVHPYKGSSVCSISPVTTLPHWFRSPARAQATSTPVLASCNSSLQWPRRSPRSALPTATPTLSPGFRRKSQSRSLRAVLAQGLAGQRAASVTRQACRCVDTGDMPVLGNFCWMDLKSHIMTGGRYRCATSTISDAHCCFLIRCQTVGPMDLAQIENAVSDAAMREYGMQEGLSH